MQHMKLLLPKGFDPDTRFWYVYGIHAKGGPYVYIGCTRWLMHRAEGHAFNQWAKSLQEWMNAESQAGRAPRMSIIARARTAKRGFAVEKQQIKKLQPICNSKHTKKNSKPIREFEIDVDCNWDKKYWIDPGDDPFT